MSKNLPPTPSQENLKKQAKALLAAHRRGDAHARERVAAFFARDVGEFGLRQAQYVIAREYGYPDWERLKIMAHVRRTVTTVIDALPPESRGQGSRFTDTVKRAMGTARREAFRSGAGQITPVHLLLGVLKEDDSSAVTALQGHPAEELARAVSAIVPVGCEDQESPAHAPFEPAAKKVLEVAAATARDEAADLVETCHLLMALAMPTETGLAVVLRQHGIDAAAIKQSVVLGREA